MAGDKVKRGFGFYLFMLLLIILAAFLVIVMVMLFSPGTSILGYKYFSFNYSEGKEIVLTETTASTEGGQKIPLDFNNIDEFNINADYANIVVSRSDADKSQDCIRIINTAKGFAKDEGDGTVDSTAFTYSITLKEEDDKKMLTVSVTEPKGFLYFSKNIVINVCAKKGGINFLGSDFIITTNSGKVSIGENLVSGLNISTNSGNIVLAENYEAKEGETIKSLAYSSLYLTTNNGRVSTPCNLIVSNDAKFSINGNGNFDLQDVTGYRGVQLAINKGNFKAKDIIGSVKVLNLNNGIIDIQGIYKTNLKTDAGSFDTNKTNTLGNSTIKLGLVGDLSIPYGESSRIEIGSLTGQSFVRTTSGSVVVKDKLTAPCIIQTTTGNVDLKIDDSKINSEFNYLSERKHLVESEKGNITLRFESTVQSLNEIRTQGDVEILMQKDSKFLLALNTYDNKSIEKLGGKTTIENVDNDQYEYPFKVNYVDASDNIKYTTNRIDVFANGKIYAHFASATVA